MLCQTCLRAFREDSQDIDASDDASPVEGYRQSAIPSPFVRATHHTLPQLKQSAEEGCQLCAFLWEAAPLDARLQFDELLGLGSFIEWLQCYFTIDRSIFTIAPGGCLVEYKYLTIEQPAKSYVVPFKKQLRLEPYRGQFASYRCEMFVSPTRY